MSRIVSGTLAPLSIYLRDIDPGEGSFPFGGSVWMDSCLLDICSDRVESYLLDRSPETVNKKTVLEA
jgi:hypothetical protein